jgi:hypothetical protein
MTRVFARLLLGCAEVAAVPPAAPLLRHRLVNDYTTKFPPSCSNITIVERIIFFDGEISMKISRVRGNSMREGCRRCGPRNLRS